MKKYILILILIFSGCSEKKIEFTKPKLQVKRTPKEIYNNKGSLYSVSKASLFEDKKDLQVGDIITVKIEDSLIKTSDRKRDTSKSTTGNYSGGVLSTTDNKGKDNNLVGFGVTTNTSNTFKGSGKSSIKETFQTEVSVIIQDIYQNGNYYIKGSKEVLIDEQMQKLVLSGVIRPYDIEADNTIDSKKIANLKIYYVNEGEEANSTHKGWGTKFLDFIWPF